MSKKIISLVTLALVGLSTFACGQEFPTDKGSKIIAGGLTFSNMGGDLYEEDGDRISTLQILPSFSSFVSPGIAIGVKGIISRTSVGDQSNTTLGIGPHVMIFLSGFQKPAKTEGILLPYLGATFFYNTMIASYKTWEGT